MGVKIYTPPASQGIMSSKAGKIGMGFATGGPAGAGMALLAANNPAAGSVANLAGGIGGSDKKVGEGSPPGVVDSTPESALTRRYNALSENPEMTVVAGLNALKDPSVPQDIRDQYAEPLLRAKHYGIGNGVA